MHKLILLCIWYFGLVYFGLVRAGPPPATCGFAYGNYFLPLSVDSQQQPPCTSYTTTIGTITLTAYTPTLETALSNGPIGLLKVCEPNLIVSFIWGPQTSTLTLSTFVTTITFPGGDTTTSTTSTIATDCVVTILLDFNTVSTAVIQCSSSAVHVCAYPNIVSGSVVETVTTTQTTTTFETSLEVTFVTIVPTETDTTITSTRFVLFTTDATQSVSTSTTTTEFSTDTVSTVVTTVESAQTVTWTLTQTIVDDTTTLFSTSTVISTLPLSTETISTTTSVTVCNISQL